MSAAILKLVKQYIGVCATYTFHELGQQVMPQFVVDAFLLDGMDQAIYCRFLCCREREIRGSESFGVGNLWGGELIEAALVQGSLQGGHGGPIAYKLFMQNFVISSKLGCDKEATVEGQENNCKCPQMFRRVLVVDGKLQIRPEVQIHFIVT